MTHTKSTPTPDDDLIFPDVQNSIYAAVEARAAAAGRSPGSSMMRAGYRRLLPGVGAGLAVVAVAGVATAATGIWNPQIGSDRIGTPSVSSSGVPARQLELLEILRGSPTPQDRGPDVRRALRAVGRANQGVRADAARLVAPANSTSGAMVLIPVERANGIDDALCLYVANNDGIGGPCVSTKMLTDGKPVALSGQPAPLTADQRRKSTTPFRAAQTRRIEARRALRRSLQPLPNDPTERRRVLQRAYAKANLNAVAVNGALAPRFTETRYTALVPDGVATVTRTAKDGEHSVRVHNNVFDLRVPNGTMTRGTLTWRDAKGQIVKTIPGV